MDWWAGVNSCAGQVGSAAEQMQQIEAAGIFDPWLNCDDLDLGSILHHQTSATTTTTTVASNVSSLGASAAQQQTILATSNATNEDGNNRVNFSSNTQTGAGFYGSSSVAAVAAATAATGGGCNQAQSLLATQSLTEVPTNAAESESLLLSQNQNHNHHQKIISAQQQQQQQVDCKQNIFDLINNSVAHNQRRPQSNKTHLHDQLGQRQSTAHYNGGSNSLHCSSASSTTSPLSSLELSPTSSQANCLASPQSSSSPPTGGCSGALKDALAGGARRQPTQDHQQAQRAISQRTATTRGGHQRYPVAAATSATMEAQNLQLQLNAMAHNNCQNQPITSMASATPTRGGNLESLLQMAPGEFNQSSSGGGGAGRRAANFACEQTNNDSNSDEQAKVVVMCPQQVADELLRGATPISSVSVASSNSLLSCAFGRTTTTTGGGTGYTDSPQARLATAGSPRQTGGGGPRVNPIRSKFSTCLNSATTTAGSQTKASTNDNNLHQQPQQQAPKLRRCRHITDYVLADEEKRLLVKEGYTDFPMTCQARPLSKSEERILRKIRRKIRNKKSAQCSRQRKKEYVEELERKYSAAVRENEELKEILTSIQEQQRQQNYQRQSNHHHHHQIDQQLLIHHHNHYHNQQHQQQQQQQQQLQLTDADWKVIDVATSPTRKMSQQSNVYG